MRLLIAPARQAPGLLAIHAVDRIISLISPDAELPPLPSDLPVQVLKFNDILEERPGLIAPSNATIEAILASHGQGDGGRTILIHCYAGISRSTAAAYALACQHIGLGGEVALAKALRAASPTATPNRLMIALADHYLGREGRMISAIEAIGRGADAYEGTVVDWRLDG